MYKKIILFGIPLILLSIFSLWSFDTDETYEPENIYEAILGFEEEVITLTGKSTFLEMPTMYSFYFEESASVICGIHFLNLSKNARLETRSYKVDLEDGPRAAVVCGVPYDEESKERTISTEGQVSIKEISNRHISGSFDINLKGDKSGKNFQLSGTFVSFPRINPNYEQW